MGDPRETLMETMAENLPVLRKKLRLSQEGLAEILGCSRSTVMLVEAGKRKMTWNTFLSLVLLFDKHPQTALLLRALEIYTPALDRYICQPGAEL